MFGLYVWVKVPRLLQQQQSPISKLSLKIASPIGSFIDLAVEWVPLPSKDQTNIISFNKIHQIDIITLGRLYKFGIVECTCTLLSITNSAQFLSRLRNLWNTEKPLVIDTLYWFTLLE